MGTETRDDFYERMNRRKEIGPVEDKRKVREELERQMREWEARGHKIELLPVHACSETRALTYNGKVIGHDKAGENKTTETVKRKDK